MKSLQYCTLKWSGTFVVVHLLYFYVCLAALVYGNNLPQWHCACPHESVPLWCCACCFVLWTDGQSLESVNHPVISPQIATPKSNFPNLWAFYYRSLYLLDELVRLLDHHEVCSWKVQPNDKLGKACFKYSSKNAVLITKYDTIYWITIVNEFKIMNGR